MPTIELYEVCDGEMVRQVMGGSEKAFAGLMRRYGGFVSAIVKKHVPLECVEDTLQDVFLRVYKSLPAFRDHDSFRSWLSVIAVRTCHDFWRQRYRSRELPVSSFTERHQEWLSEALSDDSDEQLGLQKEAREVLDLALEKLSAGDRMVLELVYLEDNSLKEAAKLLGWSVANVKVRLFRSKRKLHSLLAAQGEDGRI